MIVNEIGLKRAKTVEKEIIKSIIITLLYGTFMLFFLYFRFTIDKNILRLYLIGGLFLILFLLLMIYAPYLMIKRHIHTIREITSDNEHIFFSTFSMLWVPEKKYNIPISSIAIKKTVFDWYGKNTKKEGLILMLNKHNFYLVKEFFKDSEIFINSIYPTIFFS